MEAVRIKSNSSETSHFTLIDSARDEVTGLTGAQLNMAVLMRISDGKYYDGAAWQTTKTNLPVVEQDAVNSPGEYYYVSPFLPEDEYIVTVDTPEAVNVPLKGEIKAGDYIDDFQLIKGLLGANCVLDDFFYDENDKATAGNIYVYNSAANVVTHVSPDGGPGLLLKIIGVATITFGNTTKLVRTEV